MSEKEEHAVAKQPQGHSPAQTPDTASAPGADGGGAAEAETDVGAYPLRQKSEDPRWAVGVVWTWVSVAVFLLLFLVTLIVLGIWYD